ncbi:MAG: trigger factor, partial [Rickettsiaceae bacterium]|nr:trigger factor [Rickettsiaceae bacterium]
MQINEIQNEGLEIKYQIQFPYGSISEKVSTRLEILARDSKWPGFRPGKVPMKLVEQKFKASVVNEILEDMIEDRVNTIIKEKELKPALQPRVEDLKIEEDSNIEFTVAIEVLPKVPSVDFAKITVEKPIAEIKAQDVQDKIKELFKFRSTFKKAAKTHKAKLDDKVIIDFEGFVDGVAFAGGKGEKYPLTLGSKTFIDGFEDQLVGTKEGQSLSVFVKFPDNYGSAALQGKDAEFKIFVHEILSPETPEINDENAKEFSAENLKDLESKVETFLGNAYEAPSNIFAKLSLFDKLEEVLDFDVPPSLLLQEKAQLIMQIKNQADDEELKGKTEEEFDEYCKKIALRRVRIGLLLADYAEKNNIKVTYEDQKNEISKQIMRAPQAEEQILKYFRSSPDAL